MFQQKTGQLDHMQVLLAASGLDEFYKYFDQAPGSAGIEGLPGKLVYKAKRNKSLWHMYI